MINVELDRLIKDVEATFYLFVPSLEKGMVELAAEMQTVARDKIGHYQPKEGAFNAWLPLTAITEQDKAALGYPANAPLERTQALKDSIHGEAFGLSAQVGSNSQVAAWQESGATHYINGKMVILPPRPFIGPTGLEAVPKVFDLIEKAFLKRI